MSYKLINGNGAGLFHVEPDTGHVRVATSLADKGGSKYTLEISASDGGKTSTTNAIVDVSASYKLSTRLISHVGKIRIKRYTKASKILLYWALETELDYITLLFY